MTVFTMKQNKLRTFLKWTAVSLLWLAIWQLAAISVNNEILIPCPANTLYALFNIIKTDYFWKSVLYSLMRIIVGFSAGVTIGVVGAVVSFNLKIFKAIFSPILHLIRAVPVASFIILVFVWIKSPYMPIFISFLMVLPMIWSGTEDALAEVDSQYIEMAKVFRLSRAKIFFHIKVPSILPSFISNITTALGFSWKSGIAAEVICRPDNSLGDILQTSKLNLETPEVFAVTAVVAVLSLLLEVAVKKFTGRYKVDNN